MDFLNHRSSRLGDNEERGAASLRSDGHGDSSKLVDNRFAPFYDDYYNDSASEYGDEEYYHRPRKGDNYYGIRQEYLRSYTFVRDEPKLENTKGTMKRFRAIVWAVLCCKYKSGHAKTLREKLASSSVRFFQDSSDYVSHSCRKFTVPSCIRLSTLEVS